MTIIQPQKPPDIKPDKCRKRLSTRVVSDFGGLRSVYKWGADQSCFEA
jgi:hypothetical protein